MIQQHNSPSRKQNRTPKEKLFHVMGATKHAVSEVLSYIPLLVLTGSLSIKVAQTLSQFIDPKIHQATTAPINLPDYEKRENPTPIPTEERGLSYKKYSPEDDSIMRAWVIQTEKNMVAKLYPDTGALRIITGKDTLIIPKSDIEKPLKEYKAESIVGYNIVGNNNSPGLMNQGRDRYIKFLLSSQSGLRKIAMHLGFDKGTKEEKVKKIAQFLQSKENSMQYKHDLAMLRGTMDTTDYMRKPIISIIEGLQNGGFQGDCEDFSTNFIALAMAAGIPHDDMCIVIIPGHAFVAVKNYAMNQTDYPNFYVDQEGNKYIPVEATINAMPITTTDISHDGDIVSTSIKYERTPTVGRPHVAPAIIWNKQHPHGFKANLHGSRRYL